MNTGNIVAELLAPEPEPRPPCGNTFGELLGIVRDCVTANKAIVETLPCGWPLIDETSGGLVRGGFVGIIGGPGSGKSTLADGLILGALRENPGAKGLIVALETEPAARVCRMISRESVTKSAENCIHGLPVRAIMSGELINHTSAIEAIERLGQLGERLRIVGDVYAAAEIADIVIQEQPDIVLVDHMGLVQAGDGRESETVRQDTALALLHAAIRETSAAGIFISELSKAALSADELDLSSVRGTARFGSLATGFIALRIERQAGNDPKVTASLLKNRFGENYKQAVAVFFGGLSYMRWGSIEPMPERKTKGAKND